MGEISTYFVELCSCGDIDKLTRLIAILKTRHAFNEAMYNKGLDAACVKPHMEIIELMLAEGATDISNALNTACRFGHMPLIKYLLKKDDSRLVSAFTNACGQRNLDILELILKESDGYVNFNDGLAIACMNNCIEVVEFLIEKGANNWTLAMEYAALGGHIHLVKRMMEKGANNWNACLIHACEFGHVDVAELMIRNGGRTSRHSGFWYKHLKIVKLMTAYDINMGFAMACAMGSLDVVEYLIELGVKDFEIGLQRALQSGHLPIVQLLLERGTPLSSPCFIANNKDLLNYMLTNYPNYLDTLLLPKAQLITLFNLGYNPINGPEPALRFYQEFEPARDTYRRELAPYFPSVLIECILDAIGYMEEGDQILYELSSFPSFPSSQLRCSSESASAFSASVTVQPP